MMVDFVVPVKAISMAFDVYSVRYTTYSTEPVPPDVMVGKCKKVLFEIKKDGTYEKIKSKYSIFYLPVFKIRSY
jgi:hypothetical protein